MTAFAITGCIGPSITQQDISAAHFASLPADYQQQVRDAIGTSLKDPYSAVYKFHEPRRGWWQDGPLAGGAKHFGVRNRCRCERQNSFGAYEGEEAYFLAYQNGKLVGVSDLFNLKMAGFVE